MLPLTSAADAQVLGERLLQVIRREPIAGLAVTVSIGIAELPADGDVERVLRRADEALYAAKHAGRDRLAVHQADSAPVLET